MSPDPSSHTYDLLGTAVAHAPLIKVVKRKRPKMTRNLLSGEVHDPAPSGGGAKSSSGGSGRRSGRRTKGEGKRDGEGERARFE